jgi:exodeoxyribonuclease V alpha subunit
MPDQSDQRSQSDLYATTPPPQDVFAGAVEGTIERIVYENEENGFVVARLRERGKPGLTTFVGALLAVSPGETVRLWGRWIDDKKFGRQLRVERYETVQPSSPDAIEKYLGSGLIKGVGPAYAKKLVKAFGLDTLRVLDDEPERIASVSGIGHARAEKIRNAWTSQRAVRSIMLFLQGHGIGMSQAIRIFKFYGDKAVTVLRANPYRLAEDIHGIAFKSADEIAHKLGIKDDDPKRIDAGIIYALREASMNGHTYLPIKELTDVAHPLLSVKPETIAPALKRLEQEGGIIVEGDAIFWPQLHAAEKGVERFLKRLVSTPHENITIDMPKALAWVEKQKAIELSSEQRDAIATACKSKVMVITGGPGTGKTTVLNSLLAILEKKGVKICLAAPTGRAAKRVSEATGRESKTIHRLLEFSPKNGIFTRNEHNPISADLFVIDESSMVDIFIMHNLLKAIPPQARLILVGDVDQLPSVGPGNVLLDVIASGIAPVVWLKTVFRQAAQSGIITNAHLINQGKYPAFNDTDFFFVERKDPQKALDTVVDLVTNRIPKKFGFEPKRDIQVLSPMHRGEIGVAKLNEVLQGRLNPGDETDPSHHGLRIGDKVMQMRNNYELDTYNGDIGIITVLDKEAQEAEVRFEDRTVLYDLEQLDDVSLAYAATIHKSQGSEYPAVVIPLLTQHFMMLSRNVLYTAITRASKLVILVGDPKAVGIAVRNTKVTQRYTKLADRLKYIST